MNENPRYRADLGAALGSSDKQMVGQGVGPTGGYAQMKAEQAYNKACEQTKPIDPREQAHAILKADEEHRSLAADQTLMLTMLFPHMSTTFRQLAEGIDKWMDHQGFGTNDKGTEIALIHSEVSELLEAVRKKDHLNEAEEIADTVIRILHYCGKYNIDLGAALYSKMLKNYRRPFKHGKEF